MANVRQASVAGTFYPADPERLRDHVETMLREACSLGDSGAQSPPVLNSVATPVPLALIAPHAGYIYSGPIAASAFKTLEALSRPVNRVVVIGPSHFVPFSGVALPEAEVFETPLGKIPVDISAIDRIRNTGPIVTWDEPHRREHGIEVELPRPGRLPRLSMLFGAIELSLSLAPTCPIFITMTPLFALTQKPLTRLSMVGHRILTGVALAATWRSRV